MLERNNIQYRNLEEQVGYNTALLNLVPVGFNTDNFKGIVAPGDIDTIAEGQFALVGESAPYTLYYNDSTKGLVNLGEFPKVGPQGRDGFTGPIGQRGEPGPGWLSGPSAPDIVAQEDQLYFRYTTSDIYEYHNGQWNLIANIRGQIGPTGRQGERGPEGPQGIQGIQGEQGRPGASYAIVGWLPSIDQLPQPAKDFTGDAYIVSLLSGPHVFISIGEEWVDGGRVVAQPIEVLQVKGNSATDVMSQGAVTAELNDLKGQIDSKVQYPVQLASILGLGYGGNLNQFARLLPNRVVNEDRLDVDNNYNSYEIIFEDQYDFTLYPCILSNRTSNGILIDNSEARYESTLDLSTILPRSIVYSIEKNSDEYCGLTPIPNYNEPSHLIYPTHRKAPILTDNVLAVTEDYLPLFKNQLTTLSMNEYTISLFIPNDTSTPVNSELHLNIGTEADEQLFHMRYTKTDTYRAEIGFEIIDEINGGEDTVVPVSDAIGITITIENKYVPEASSNKVFVYINNVVVPIYTYDYDILVPYYESPIIPLYVSSIPNIRCNISIPYHDTWIITPFGIGFDADSSNSNKATIISTNFTSDTLEDNKLYLAQMFSFPLPKRIFYVAETIHNTISQYIKLLSQQYGIEYNQIQGYPLYILPYIYN